ncbi:nuclear transport factor 2 family protein [candidate division KSB1 bacterium]|nr:nuclear transport factor 2 family protein [candidate division KSB1 bacterium]
MTEQHFSKQVTEVALRGIINAIRKAFELKNAQVMNRFLADEFQCFAPNGRVYNRESSLFGLEDIFTKCKNFKLSSVPIHVEACENFGWARYQDKVMICSTPENTEKVFWITIVFEKQVSKWLMIHLHISPALPENIFEDTE